MASRRHCSFSSGAKVTGGHIIFGGQMADFGPIGKCLGPDMPLASAGIPDCRDCSQF